MEAAVMSAAQFICKFTALPLAKKVKSIWNNEKQIKELGDTVDRIRDDVEGKRFQEEGENTDCKGLRNAFLDAEDFLDRVQTLKMKKDLEARMLKEEKEEIINNANGKFKLYVGLVGIKLKPFKNEAIRFFSKKNQAIHALKVNNEVNNKIKKVRKNLNAILTDKQKDKDTNKREKNNLLARASGPCVNTTNIFGRDEDKRKIVDMLLRPTVDQQKIPVVSIVAPGGMGKTTTAQLVYNDESLQELFDPKLWVSDSKSLDLKSLLKHILKSICSDVTDLDNLEADHLKKRITDNLQGKRFFLVLDDVVNENRIIWDNLKGLLDYGSKESRILVTTRSRTVAKVVDSTKSTSYELTGLSKEGSSQLFENLAFGETRDERLVEIGGRIVEKCCGVPLAIKVVGSLLRDEGIHKWEYFRDNSLTEKTDAGDQIMDILKLSYNDLDPTLKECFSFCALFPKNYRINTEILSDIWMANVCFKLGNGETVEDACDKSLRILYNRCFLEVGRMRWDHNDITCDDWDDIECFKLHDLMHDLVKEVAGAEIVLSDSNELHIEEDVRHVMLDFETSIFEPKGKRVRSFLLHIDRFDCLESYFRISNFDKFVLDCPYLRYLDVSGGVIENLTESIGELVHLRYLCLASNGIKTLPHSISKLINLRKLELANTDLTHLPPGMGALTSLEVLDLSGCFELKKLPRGIEKLLKLKKLLLQDCRGLVGMSSGMSALLGVCEPTMFIVGVDPEESDQEESNQNNAQLEELGDLSDILAELVIDLRGYKTICKEGDETYRILLNKMSLRKLEIKWRHYWIPREEDEEVCENQMEVLLKLQPPTSLEELILKRYHGMEFPGWMPRDGFASVLPNLASLHLQDCNGFRYLPPLNGLERLRVLRLDNLDSLEYIVKEESDSEATPCLPQLESLELRSLSKFKGWRRGIATNESVDLPLLSRIDIWWCPNLTASTLPLPLVLKAFDLSSPSSSFDYLFDHVCKNRGRFILSKEGKEDSLHLMIAQCDFIERGSSSYMEEAFRGASHRLTHLRIFGSKGLKTLPGLHHLTALRELYIESCPEFTWEQEDAVEEQRRVDEDEVGDDMETTPHHMDSTPPPSAHHLSWKRLTSLQKMTFSQVPNMVKLPDGLQYITSLHTINIWGCENLQVPDWVHQTYNISHAGSNNKFFSKK